MTPLGENAQPYDCSLTHMLLAYWRKFLIPRPSTGELPQDLDGVQNPGFRIGWQTQKRCAQTAFTFPKVNRPFLHDSSVIHRRLLLWAK